MNAVDKFKQTLRPFAQYKLEEALKNDRWAAKRFLPPKPLTELE